MYNHSVICKITDIGFPKMYSMAETGKLIIYIKKPKRKWLDWLKNQ